jgi:hypothetical protein
MAIGPGAPDASEPARTWPATFGCSCETRTSSPRPSRIASGRSSPLRVTGLTNRQIGARLHVTLSTVRTHLSWALHATRSSGATCLPRWTDPPRRLARRTDEPARRSPAQTGRHSQLAHPDMTNANPTADLSDHLTRLVYELLDAHYDTARLAEDVAEDERWHAHLAYLRDLQRVAREVLATAEDEACASRTSARRG